MAYYVYLLASKKHGTLYLGVTNDIAAWKIPGGSISILASQADTGVMDSGLALRSAPRNDEWSRSQRSLKTKTPASLPGFCIVELA
jgi:hypothetical protein